MPNHRDTMQQLARKREWKRGIELGLGSGKLFARFLSEQIEMIGVDIGARADRKAEIERLISDPETMGKVIRVYWMPAHDAAPLVPDNWADFVFIDAAHTYEAVKRDIADWQAKVKPNGWLGGHDYHEAFPGVIRAVDEAFGKDGIELLDGYIWVRK